MPSPNDTITVSQLPPAFSLPSGGTAPSGVTTVDNGGVAVQNLSQAIPPLSIEVGAARSRNFGFGLNIRDTDTDFTRSIDDEQDQTRNMERSIAENLLTQEQCDRIDACIVSLQATVCGTDLGNITELKECADKIFDQACALEDKLLENVQCQIQDAKCQFYRQASLRWQTVARAVGSSRNTFVIQQQDTAMVELTSKLARLNAELSNTVIQFSQQNLQSAYSAKVVSRLDAYQQSYGRLNSLWGLIRGAKRTLGEGLTDVNNTVKTSQEVSQQDIKTFDWAGKYAEQVQQQTDTETAYAGDYASANVITALLGII